MKGLASLLKLIPLLLPRSSGRTQPRIYWQRTESCFWGINCGEVFPSEGRYSSWTPDLIGFSFRFPCLRWPAWWTWLRGIPFPSVTPTVWVCWFYLNFCWCLRGVRRNFFTFWWTCQRIHQPFWRLYAAWFSWTSIQYHWTFPFLFPFWVLTFFSRQDWPKGVFFVIVLQAFCRLRLRAWTLRSFLIFLIFWGCFLFFCWWFHGRNWFFRLFGSVCQWFFFRWSKWEIGNCWRFFSMTQTVHLNFSTCCGFWEFSHWPRKSVFCNTKCHAWVFRSSQVWYLFHNLRLSRLHSSFKAGPGCFWIAKFY